MINSRFTVAVHLLTLMAFGCRQCPGVPMTSEVASESVNTNPVVIRRILGSLRKAGIVSSYPGPRGGWLLERDPDRITLQEVYRAVEEDHLFSMHHRQPNASCQVGSRIQETLNGVFREAEAAMEARLGEQSIADVTNEVLMGGLSDRTCRAQERPA